MLRKAVETYTGIPEDPTALKADGNRLRIFLRDYLPPSLLELKADVAAARIDLLKLPEPLEAVIDYFLEVFAPARIVNLEPIAPEPLIVPGAKIQERPIGWTETRNKLQRLHCSLVNFVGEVRKSLSKGVDILRITGGSSGILVSHNGAEIATSMGQDRVLATLALLGLPEWVSVSDFCRIYKNSEDTPEPDKYFGTAVGQLKKIVPSLSWESDWRGSRKLTGMRIENTVSAAELRQFLATSLGKRKPYRKRARG